MTISLSCPAKINEFLAVGPKDDKGYHPIRTVFQTVSLFDTLTISDETDKASFTCNWDLPGRNTVTKTLTLIYEYREVPPLAIHLQKEIPTQAGLGGGSSDAGTLLKHINTFLKVPLKQNELQDIAAAVGADVPFFLLGGRAVGEGYGEVLTPLTQGDMAWVVIARPNVDCPTEEMYAMLDYLDYPWLERDEGLSLHNDFLRVAPMACLNLVQRLQELSEGRAGMTGSGSALFALYDSFEAAKQTARVLTDDGVPWVRVCRTL